MKNKLILSISTFLCLCAAATAQITIVNFGGSGMVDSNQGLDGNGSLLDPNTSISPAAGYLGQTFYGGVVATNTTVGTWQIDNNVARGGAGMPVLDWVSAVTSSTVIGAGTKFHRGIVFFQQSDFLAYNSLAGGVELTSLSVAVHRSSGNPSRFGFVIEADGAYFISNPVTYNQFSGTGFNANFTNGHYLNIADASAATWLAFDPEASLSVIGAVASPDLTKVTGVGVWFENERASNSDAGLGFHMTGIEVVAIPEPSTYAALFGVFALGLVMWRRRNR
jgi:hypothetical protein